MSRETLIEIIRTVICLVILFGTFMMLAERSEALDNSSRVPVLLYHPQSIGHNCNADDTDVLALERYMTLRSRRWCLPRMTHLVSWRTGEELRAILRGAE